MSQDRDGFLKERDREYLNGELNIVSETTDDERDITEETAQNRKTGIRSRLRGALYDVELLLNHQAAWKSNMFVRGMSAEREDDVYSGLVAGIGLMYSLARRSPVPEERIFEEGIRRGAGYAAQDVNVEIDVEYPPVYDFTTLREKIKSGELPNSWEIGAAAMSGDLQETVQFGEEEKTVQEWVRELADRRDTDEFIRVV